MENAWYLIVIVGIVVAGILFFRSNSRRSRVSDANQAMRRNQPTPDHVADREVSRLAHMTNEDRDWETASLQRNRANQEQKAADASQSL